MKKIKKVATALAVRLIYFTWSVWNHFFYLPRIKFASKDVKRLLKRTPCILIANHTAHADGYLLPQVLPTKRLYTYVTRKWYDKPKLNWMFSNLRYIPIDLSSLDTEWLARGEEVIQNGGSILIFPEGKLCDIGTLGEFHPGALMLAKKCNVPVVPIALHGDYHAFCRKKIVIGDPVSLSLNERGRPSVILRREMEKCHDIMRDMLGIPPALPAPQEDEAENPVEERILVGTKTE